MKNVVEYRSSFYGGGSVSISYAEHGEADKYYNNVPVYEWTKIICSISKAIESQYTEGNTIFHLTHKQTARLEAAIKKATS